MTLYIICGLPGSGKSTYAKKLAFINGIECHYEADMAMYENDRYVFQRAKLPKAHAWCQNMTEEAMSQNKDVIVSNTFLRKKEVKPYIKLAEKYGYKVHIVRMHSNFGSIHGVPPDVYARMKSMQEFYDINDF